jgi:hypothetical protein
VKPDVDDFTVGELSATLKDALGLAKKELKISDYKTAIVNENGQKYYVLGLFVGENQSESVESIVESLAVIFQFKKIYNLFSD